MVFLVHFHFYGGATLNQTPGNVGTQFLVLTEVWKKMELKIKYFTDTKQKLYRLILLYKSFLALLYKLYEI